MRARSAGSRSAKPGSTSASSQMTNMSKASASPWFASEAMARIAGAKKRRSGVKQSAVRLRRRPPPGPLELAVIADDAVAPQPAQFHVLDSRRPRRQRQRLQQLLDFPTGGNLRGRQRAVVDALLDRIERGQADREQFSENDAVVQTVGEAVAELARQSADADGDLLGVVAGERGDAVAHHHPIDHAVVDDAALASRLQHEIGVVGDGAAPIAIVMDAREHVDVDVGIVERRDQRVGQRMGEPHQIGIAGRSVDDHEFVVVLDVADGLREVGEFLGLVGAHVVAFATPHRAMARQLDRPARMLGPRGAIFEKARHRLLPRVEIDAGDLVARLQKRNREMDRQRRLAGPTLLVADDDDMGAAQIGILVIKIHVANRRSQTHGIIGAMPPPWQTPSLRRAGRRGFPALFCAHAGSAWPMMREIVGNSRRAARSSASTSAWTASIADCRSARQWKTP